MTDIDPAEDPAPEKRVPAGRTWADQDRELWLAGLSIQRAEGLARGPGTARTAAVERAMEVLSGLVEREFVITDDARSSKGRLSPTERRALWVARGIVGGRQERDAERFWHSHSALLETFFNQPPFTQRVSDFDGDFTAVLSENPERFDDVRQAFGVLSELAVPSLPDDERERLLDDLLRTPARPADALRRSRGRTDLYVRSCMAQALLSGVPAAVVEEHRSTRLFDFQDPENRFVSMSELLDRRIRRTLERNGVWGSEQDGLIGTASAETGAPAMLHWGLARFMTWIRIGALPSKDLWLRAQLSKYTTFERGLKKALAERGDHEPIPEYDGWEPSSRKADDPVQHHVLAHLAAAAAGSGLEEAARATVTLMIAGPAPLRTYYAIDKDSDKELRRCQCAVEAARYWLRIRAKSSGTTLDQLREAHQTVDPSSSSQRRQRTLPLVAWTAKEFLDAVIHRVDLSDADALLRLRLRIRLATLHALPPAVRSACDRNPEAPPARRVGVLAHAVLGELAELPLADITTKAFSEDPELSRAALEALAKELNDGYGDLPAVAERLTNEVIDRLHSPQEHQQ